MENLFRKFGKINFQQPKFPFFLLSRFLQMQMARILTVDGNGNGISNWHA